MLNWSGKSIARAGIESYEDVRQILNRLKSNENEPLIGNSLLFMVTSVKISLPIMLAMECLPLLDKPSLGK
jgi:hypothetical protein